MPSGGWRAGSRMNCCVPLCHSVKWRNPELSFHRFPKDKMLKKRWILAFRIGNEVSARMVVCSKHFQASDFSKAKANPKHKFLKRYCIPTQNLPNSSGDTENSSKNPVVILAKIQEKKAALPTSNLHDNSSKHEGNKQSIKKVPTTNLPEHCGAKNYTFAHNGNKENNTELPTVNLNQFQKYSITQNNENTTELPTVNLNQFQEYSITQNNENTTELSMSNPSVCSKHQVDFSDSTVSSDEFSEPYKVFITPTRNNENKTKTSASKLSENLCSEHEEKIRTLKESLEKANAKYKELHDKYIDTQKKLKIAEEKISIMFNIFSCNDS